MNRVRMNRIVPAMFCVAVLAGIAPSSNANLTPPTPEPRGTILCEFFRGIPGNDIKNLTDNPAFPASPTSGELIYSFDIPADGEQFGSLVRGYIYPPATGNYTFWIAADDSGQLFLSPGSNPAEKKLICQCSTWVGPHEWTRSPEQQSKPIALTAGKAYYIEALHKQGEGDSHLSVGWRLPDGKEERPIPGNRLSPAGAPKAVPPTHVTLDPATPRSTAYGFHKYQAGAAVQGPGGGFKMSYLMFLPKDYQTTQEKKPMFIFLCGNSHQGGDLEGILNEGPANYLANDQNLKEHFPFIGFFPQPPDGTRWDTPGMPAAVAATIPEIEKAYRIDPDRVYLTGLSMGGKGTWLVSQQDPSLFAGIAPISAVAVRPESAPERLRDLSIWIICGADDGDFTAGSKQMYAAMKAAGDDVSLDVREHEGHGVWGHYYDTMKFYERLLTWKRKPHG